MASPLQAWRRTPPNRHLRASSAVARRANRGFTPPASKACGTLKCTNGAKGLVAAGVLPTVADLGALIGSLVTSQKKKKKQEGKGRWRVAEHQPFLLNLIRGDRATWGRKIHQAGNQQLRALTDVIRNLYDNVVPLPSEVKLP